MGWRRVTGDGIRRLRRRCSFTNGSSPWLAFDTPMTYPVTIAHLPKSSYCGIRASAGEQGMRHVSYYQSVFDLLDIRPKDSPQAWQMIEAGERRRGKRLPE